MTPEQRRQTSFFLLLAAVVFAVLGIVAEAENLTGVFWATAERIALACFFASFLFRP